MTAFVRTRLFPEFSAMYGRLWFSDDNAVNLNTIKYWESELKAADVSDEGCIEALQILKAHVKQWKYPPSTAEFIELSTGKRRVQTTLILRAFLQKEHARLGYRPPEIDKVEVWVDALEALDVNLNVLESVTADMQRRLAGQSICSLVDLEVRYLSTLKGVEVVSLENAWSRLHLPLGGVSGFERALRRQKPCSRLLHMTDEGASKRQFSKYYHEAAIAYLRGDIEEDLPVSPTEEKEEYVSFDEIDLMIQGMRSNEWC
ncbi:hypothetical protein [Neptuniibacter sp. QD37_11]|uniref:hypothetical protein n=1 Tax=Neptuniibacter sp. QD37_11 TaxID=3398209 RepID=UPI0039F5566F